MKTIQEIYREINKSIDDEWKELDYTNEELKSMAKGIEDDIDIMTEKIRDDFNKEYADELHTIKTGSKFYWDDDYPRGQFDIELILDDYKDSYFPNPNDHYPEILKWKYILELLDD